ncbi:Crossover junction endonuclease mus81 [Branchiostoma belcheri]|nr:Crossover junction endonuclease mus81 [Branchiostoma belcheri]
MKTAVLTLVLFGVCATADVGTTEGTVGEKDWQWCNCADIGAWKEPACAALCPPPGILGKREVPGSGARLCDCAVPASLWTRLTCYRTYLRTDTSQSLQLQPRYRALLGGKRGCLSSKE